MYCHHAQVKLVLLNEDSISTANAERRLVVVFPLKVAQGRKIHASRLLEIGCQPARHHVMMKALSLLVTFSLMSLLVSHLIYKTTFLAFDMRCARIGTEQLSCMI